MRGRWGSAALGAGLARRLASFELDQQAQAYESQLQHSQQQIEAQQRQIEALQRQQTQHHPQPQQQHEDLTEKLKKFAELKKQGIITEEESQKLKADLLSKM
jgi:multidrug resistance efflux pump